jgi:putative transposase
MGRAAPAPVLTSGEREGLEDLIRAHSTAQQIAKRARMIVLASEGLKIWEVAARLGVWRKTVSEWRGRWLSSSGAPATVEERLSDAPRSGAPARITAEKTCAIVALACEAPKDTGLPFSHWSQQTLADEAMRRDIIDWISQRSVGRILKRSGPEAASGALLADAQARSRVRRERGADLPDLRRGDQRGEGGTQNHLHR